MERWPLRRILKFARLYEWTHTTPEQREEQRKEKLTREWADRVRQKQKDKTDQGRELTIDQLRKGTTLP
jgi:urease accessory protein UreE